MAPPGWKVVCNFIWITACLWSLQIFTCNGNCSHESFHYSMVNCLLTEPEDYDDASNVPNNISDLTIVVQGIFYPGLLCLDDLYGIKTLRFIPNTFASLDKIYT